MAFVSTLSAVDANSYISVAKAVSRLGDIPQSDGVAEWLSLSSGDQEKTLVAATKSLEGLRWKGIPATTTQALAWPRYTEVDYRRTTAEELPYDLELATAYTAAFLGLSGGYTAVSEGGGVDDQATGFEGLRAADLESYEQVDLGNGAIKLKLADFTRVKDGVEYIPPFALQLIGRYLKNAGAYSINGITRSSVARVSNPFIRGYMHPFNTGNTRYVNGQIYPAYGGWGSNPL